MHRCKSSIAARRGLIALVFFLSVPISFQSAWGQNVDWTTAITRVAEKSIPAVAHINITQTREVAAPFFGAPFPPDFFGGPGPKKFKRTLRGIGSGVIIKPDGYILTNNHVVEGATTIQVVLPSGEEYRAKVIGKDPKTDLAVIKVPAKNQLPFLKFGNSDNVVVGQWVIAIGHPRGLSQSVSQGIVSATHRRGITDPSTYQDFLQTDAAINPGSSGGPLLNLSGEVIGINAVIASASGGFEGIGFSIPSNIAVYVMNELITHGKVERGWLGVSVQDVTYELARKSGLKKNAGALVIEITQGSPAEKAGLKKGDIILEYNGRPVSDSAFLQNDVAVAKSGSSVKLAVLRDGKRITVPVTIGSQATASKLMAASVKKRLGIDVRPVSEKETEKFGLPENPGVAVKSVDKRGPLGREGIESEDILLEIEGEPISGPDAFDQFISAIPSGSKIVITVLDHRTGQVGSISVKLK